MEPEEPSRGAQASGPEESSGGVAWRRSLSQDSDLDRHKFEDEDEDNLVVDDEDDDEDDVDYDEEEDADGGEDLKRRLSGESVGGKSRTRAQSCRNEKLEQSRREAVKKVATKDAKLLDERGDLFMNLSRSQHSTR